MKKHQAAEAKPETKDIKADEQKPKVPVPQWAGVGELFRDNLETSDPFLSNQPQLYVSFTSVNDGSKSVLRLLNPIPNMNPIPLPLPSLNLVGPTCTSGRSRNAPARTLTQLLNPGPTNSFNPRCSDQKLTHPSTPVPTTAPQPGVSPG